MIDMISVSVRLNRDNSVTINVSPRFMRLSNAPSFRSRPLLRPLTTSVSQRSMCRLRNEAKRSISSRWFLRCCFSVLILK